MAWSRKSQVESRKSNVEVHASAFAYDAIVVLASPGKKGESKELRYCIPQIPGQSELMSCQNFPEHLTVLKSFCQPLFTGIFHKKICQKGSGKATDADSRLEGRK